MFCFFLGFFCQKNVLFNSTEHVLIFEQVEFLNMIVYFRNRFLNERTMLGIISINFINDTSLINTYPIIMYYNGDKENVVKSITEELSQFIYKNCISLDTYAKTKMYVVTYCTEDNSIDSDETTEKYLYNIEEMYKLSEHTDIKTKLLNEILNEFSNIIGDYDNIVRQLLSNNVTLQTIKHFVRHRAQEAMLLDENITELMKTFNETYEQTNNS